MNDDDDWCDLCDGILLVGDTRSSYFSISGCIAISVVETPWPSGISDLRAIYCCQTPVSGDNGRTA